MGLGRHLGKLPACLAAVGFALTMGAGTAHADVIGGNGGCAWTAPDGGCSYVAATNLGTVAWVGGGQPAVTADGSPTCVGGVACATAVNCITAADSSVGVCTFEQTAGAPVAVSDPGSTLGVAGTPIPGVPPISQSVASACVWTAGSGGCSFTAQVTGITEATVAWANATTPPLVDGQGPNFCLVAPGAQDVCVYPVLDAVAGQPVTVTADLSSSGAAAETDNI